MAIALLCIAGLILSFSKGSGLSSRYKILLHSENAAGLIPGAKVLMSGVPVGNIKTIQMNEDGKSVTLIAEVLTRYRVHADAVFTPRQSGFIGSAVNAVTRAGTNNFSGSVYTYFRSENQQGNKVGKATFVKQNLKFNQYGARFGGPIIKNKLFFFVNAELNNKAAVN